MITRLSPTIAALWRKLRDPEMINEAPSYEYKVVPVATLGHLDSVQNLIDQYSLDHWRLVETLTSDGFTVALIFERTRMV